MVPEYSERSSLAFRPRIMRLIHRRRVEEVRRQDEERESRFDSRFVDELQLPAVCHFRTEGSAAR